MSEWLGKVVVLVIITVWTLTTVVLPFAIKDYTPPPEVGTTMGIVAGAAAAVIFARRGDKKRTGDTPEREDEDE